jgi:hypothetical protein
MTAVKTMQIRIINPQAERVIADLASKEFIELDEPEETPLEWYRRWCRESEERQMKEGPFVDEPELTTEEIVALCKEARRERYARKQEAEKQKNSTCR